MQRTCPNCGEYVQSDNLTCPKCFKEIPRDPPRETSGSVRVNSKRNVKDKNSNIAAFLAILPPFIGLLGLGMIYQEPKNSQGYWFLLAGLLIFIPFLGVFFLMLNSGILSAALLFIVSVILLLIYISAAVAAFIETVFGSVLSVLRF